MAHIIVGLGNPGPEYESTRHNTGRAVVQAFAQKFEAGEWQHDKKLKALITKARVDTKKAELVLPENFMNSSGASLKPLFTSVKAVANLVVVYDDLDLPIGTVKIAFDRGSGGHKGLDSVIKALKTTAFVRVRVGICSITPSGKPKKPQGEEAVIKHILGNFSAKEQEKLKLAKKRALEALELIMVCGYEKAANSINSR